MIPPSFTKKERCALEVEEVALRTSLSAMENVRHYFPRNVQAKTAALREYLRITLEMVTSHSSVTFLLVANVISYFCK